jgi:hypothetical protein
MSQTKYFTEIESVVNGSKTITKIPRDPTPEEIIAEVEEAKEEKERKYNELCEKFRYNKELQAGSHYNVTFDKFKKALIKMDISFDIVHSGDHWCIVHMFGLYGPNYIECNANVLYTWFVKTPVTTQFTNDDENMFINIRNVDFGSKFIKDILQIIYV